MAQRILSALYWFWLGGSGAVIQVFSFFLAPFTLLDPKRRVAHFLSFVWSCGLTAAMPRVSLEWVNRDRLSAETGSFLLVPNHTSLADIILMIRFWPWCVIVGRQYMFRIPHLHLAGYIPAGEGGEGEAERMLRIANQRIAAGVPILVFPEGQRSMDGKVMRFKPAVFMLAKQAGIKVFPIAISGCRTILPKGTTQYCFRSHVRIEVLEPIETIDDPRVAAKEANRRVKLALAKVGELPPEQLAEVRAAHGMEAA